MYFDRVYFELGWLWSGGFWTRWILIGWILSRVDFDRMDFNSDTFIGWVLTRVDFDRSDFERGWILIVYRKIDAAKLFTTQRLKYYQLIVSFKSTLVWSVLKSNFISNYLNIFEWYISIISIKIFRLILPFWFMFLNFIATLCLILIVLFYSWFWNFCF